MRRITFITGGQRSGKSTFAMEMALKESSNPVYLATSRIYDEEHRKRIDRHRKDREGKNWETVEEDLQLSKHDLSGRVVVIDCVTLWANNNFADIKDDEKCLAVLKHDFDQFVANDAHFIFVSNEIGLCEQSMNELQRRFTALLGWLNQHIASKSDEAYLLVSGIPVMIK